MANRTDPLISSVSGSDPQNCLEYITRQRIYDCRYWKEVCFGLSVTDVLEKSVEQIKCLGTIPYTTFISLLLKLLQLNADYEIINVAFIEQDEFKYTRALGMLYIRLTSRPADIYKSLEPYYNDYRKLRIYHEQGSKPTFEIIHMDQYIHQLLTSTTIFGITLPRLPNRNSLQMVGYLPKGIRPTALKDVILQYNIKNNNGHNNKNNTEQDDDTKLYYELALQCLKDKALIDKSQSAIIAWNKRSSIRQQLTDESSSINDQDVVSDTIRDNIKEEIKESSERILPGDRVSNETQQQDDSNFVVVAKQEKSTQKQQHDYEEEILKKSKKKRKHERNYDNLFKKSNSNNNSNSKTTKDYNPSVNNESSLDEKAATGTTTTEMNHLVEGSDEYWNEQRKILGLKPLKK